MERDYKSVHRYGDSDSRIDNEYGSRRRNPTALDPYEYPGDRDELKRNIAEVKARNKRYQEQFEYSRDDRAYSRPQTSRTTYSVSDAGVGRERESPRLNPAPRSVRRDYDQRDTRTIVSRPREERYASDHEYIHERPQHTRDGYVVDARDAEVLEVYTGQGNRETDYYVNSRDNAYRKSKVMYRERDGPRSSAPSLHGTPYMSGARLEGTRSQNAIRAPSRATLYEDDRSRRGHQSISGQSKRDEEWDFVEKLSIRDTEPVHDTPVVDRASETHRGRRRASTSQSEHDYVMVTPPKTGLRSALVRKERQASADRDQRRRSRGIQIREEDVVGHYCGEKFAERPGTEAAMMGKYLKHYEIVDEQDRGHTSRSRRRQSEGYPTQKIRSHSRRRRDDDEQSYISTKLTKTIKDTYY